MKLWLLTQKGVDTPEWDTFEYAVVVAEDEDGARGIHPSGEGLCCGESTWSSDEWASSPNGVNAEYIGEAKDGTESGTVIAACFKSG